MQQKLVDLMSFIFAGVIFLITLIVFYSDSGAFLGSLIAAIISGALAWISYVLTRWLALALRK